MLNLCWSITKRFLSVLVVFGKYFFLTKIVKNSKTVLPCSGNSVAGRTSRMPQSQVHNRDFSRLTSNSLAGKCFSREKGLEYFQKSRFSCFSRLRLATFSRVEGPVARRLRDFHGLPRDSLTGRTSSLEKHLNKFFKIFVLSVLVTGPGDFLVTWLNRENCVCCAYR